MAPAAMAAPEIGEALEPGEVTEPGEATKTAAAAATTSLETGEAAAKMALACDFEARYNPSAIEW